MPLPPVVPWTAAENLIDELAWLRAGVDMLHALQHLLPADRAHEVGEHMAAAPKAGRKKRVKQNV